MKEKCAVKWQSIIVFGDVYRSAMMGFQPLRLRVVNENKVPLLQ